MLRQTNSFKGTAPMNERMRIYRGIGPEIHVLYAASKLIKFSGVPFHEVLTQRNKYGILW